MSRQRQEGSAIGSAPPRILCWTASWNPAQPATGIEHLALGDGTADSVIVGVDDDAGPFRLYYELGWDPQWRLRRAALTVVTAPGSRSLQLQANGRGRWRRDGASAPDLDGCIDIDIWPTPFTNSFPIRRDPIAVGERRTFSMTWVDAVAMTVKPQPQAYARLADDRYRFESLDGSGFTAELHVDADGFIVDYPGLFRRIRPAESSSVDGG